jgi:tetratricopeptide (TPR) repeat protein
MNATQIQTIFKSVIYCLSSGQLIKAFEKTSNLVDELQLGEYADRLNDLQQNYNYLLHYFIEGIDDSQRKIVYNKLISKTFILNSELKEELLFRNSSNFEYTQKRYFPHTKHYNSPSELLISLNYYHSQTLLIGKLENTHEAELKRLRSNYETALSEIFKVFWLTSTFGDQEKTLITKILDVKYEGWVEKTLMISAITLNLWRTFDESKLLLLFDCCQVADQRAKQRALVGLCLVLVRYNHFIPYFPAVRNRLVLLADDIHIVENFHNIIIQLISTAETEKISKKMREEILPEMMKISPLLKDKMDTDSLLNKDEWEEENPAWQELIEKSGMSDKLHELNELQMEGADVYMSTFSMLKNFPFFAEFSNWFLPFDGQNSNVNQLFATDDKSLLSAFVGNNLMCNSDKYSFCLSILQMPENQRGMLRSTFKMEAEQLDEITKDEAILKPDLASKNISKQYIQDLFRVFNLHPQHADFSDIFDSSLAIHRSFLFDILSTNTDFNTSIAEYYFSKNHYTQALEIFEKILHEITPTAAIYQKVAYSYQQISQISKALDAYLKADIIEPDDVWTIRKIALCYRLSGNFEKSLEYYQHADFLKPNQSSILLRIGHCFLELKKYKEALDVYFKLDAEETENPKVWRAITWCAFVSGNIQQAEYYANKLIETSATAHDYLNAGHIAWCSKQPKNALEFYRKSLDLQQNNWELFLESFLKDKLYLVSNAVDADEIPLMLDALKTPNR